jgi:hypothetical protein
MSEETNWRSPKRITLNVAVLYTATYYGKDDRGTVAKAKEVLDKYNFELKVWPEGGQKGAGNMLEDFTQPIPHTKEAYAKLRARVNELIRRGSGFTWCMPAVYSLYEHRGYGITPPWFKQYTPGCLIAPAGNDDKMDLVHEIGHGAECDHVVGDLAAERENFMHEANGRSTIRKSQVEKLMKATFAVA